MDDLERDLAAWCQSDVDAFNAGDLDKIVSHWTFPALTTQAERSFVFKTAEHFSKNTGRLLSFYAAQSVDRVERELQDCKLLQSGVATMTVSDVMYDVRGEEIVAWTAAYVLQRVDGTWKAVMAVADGETNAWAARGTPLGG